MRPADVSNMDSGPCVPSIALTAQQHGAGPSRLMPLSADASDMDLEPATRHRDPDVDLSEDTDSHPVITQPRDLVCLSIRYESGRPVGLFL